MVDVLSTRGEVASDDELWHHSRWDDELVARHDIDVVDVPLVSVGAGLASFALVDHLRIAGVAASDIAVLGPDTDPAANYRRLASNSQIPDDERLRSDSGSTIDNIWGFPSYALREAWQERSLRPIGKVVAEPVMTEYFTPRAGQVYRSIQREAARIGWSSMLRPGWVRTVRRRRDGGYYTLLTASHGSERRVAYRSRYVHIGVGYPGVALLADLARFREQHPAHAHRVVNAYESHEFLYDELATRPSTVVVRGNGIVASRVLQRLFDDREQGAETQIVHLFRNYIDGPQGRRPWFRRPAGGGFAYQSFNFPKAAWGGQLRRRLAALEGEERASLLQSMGGTTTAPRRAWRRQLARATRDGAYHQISGTVEQIVPHPDRGIRLHVAASDGAPLDIDATYVLDATGLLSDLAEHRVLADLLAHGGAARNVAGRLDVDQGFEVRGASSGGGTLFASGAMTLGGYYAGVDSFLGLQYAAVQIMDRLADEGFCAPLSLRRSVSGWWDWARNRTLS